MIKQALEYIVGLNAPAMQDVGEYLYSDKPLYQIDEGKRADSIGTSTLTSIVDYIKSASESEMLSKAFIQIVSPTEVRLISHLDVDRKREVLIKANAQLPKLQIGQYIDNENFIIMLQSMFVQNSIGESNPTDIDLLQKVVGNVVDDTIQTYTDDGISQQAAIKSGITTKETVILPSPATLRPYRTFLEVMQPASKFVFRMKKGMNGPTSALFEADGGAWKNFAMDNIKRYFEEQLEEYHNITVIC